MGSFVLASGFGLGLGVGALSFGPLDEVREEVHGTSSSSDDDDDDDDGDSGWLGCLLCGSGSGGSATIDGGGRGRAMSLENWPHPYADGAPGYYLDRDEARAEGARKWNIRADASAAYVVEGLWRGGAGARVGAGIFEFDTAWDWFYDPRTVDSLTLGDFNLGISPVRGRHFVIRAGLGARVMFDSKPAVEGESGPAGGFNVMTGFTVFPVRPVVLSADFDFGSLGSAFVWKAGGRLGVMMGPLEVFAGADHTRIGKVGLTGVSFGVGAWF